MAMTDEDILKAAQPYLPIVQDAAKQYGVDPTLMLGMLAQESGFNPGAQSKKGAQGIAQFIPDTAKRYGVDVKDPMSSIRGMAAYLADAQKRGITNPQLLAASYNAGFTPSILQGQVPQNSETPNYVNKVLQYQKLFQPQGGTTNFQTPQSGAIPPVASPIAQSPQISSLLSGIDPSQLIDQTPGLPSGLKGLITALAIIGTLGGTAANVIGGVKRYGREGAGNSALAQSGDLFGLLTKNAQEEQKQEDISNLAKAPSLDPRLRAIAAVGGRPALQSALLGQVGQLNPLTQLDIQRKQQEIEANTPEGIAAANKAILDRQISLNKAEQQNKVGENADDLKTFAGLKNKLDAGQPLSIEEQAQFTQLGTKLKAAPPEAAMKFLTDPTNGIIEKHNTDFQMANDLKTVRSILDRIPTSQAARFQGTSQEFLQKFVPNADRAQLQQLEFILSRAITRNYIGEKGRIPVQEYGNANTALLNLLAKSPEERTRLLNNLDEVFQDQEKTTYSQIKLWGKQYFGKDITQDPDFGVKGSPDQLKSAPVPSTGSSIDALRMKYNY